MSEYSSHMQSKDNFVQLGVSQPPHPFLPYLPFPLYLDTLLLHHFFWKEILWICSVHRWACELTTWSTTVKLNFRSHFSCPAWSELSHVFLLRSKKRLLNNPAPTDGLRNRGIHFFLLWWLSHAMLPWALKLKINKKNGRSQVRSQVSGTPWPETWPDQKNVRSGP
jgi:hypothetical protein